MNRSIGATKVRVFPIGLGAMPMSIQGRPNEKQSLRTIDAALDAGVNFIDTADVYCLDDSDIGHNERLIAKALAARGNPPNVWVATKGGLRRPNGNWTTDASPGHLRDACQKSLKALGVERIFLYQLHARDDKVSLERSVEELAKLQREGKIQHVGLSNVDLDDLKAAQKIVRIETVQNRAHIFSQSDFRRGLVSECQKQKVTYLAYSPVGGGHGHSRLMSQTFLKRLATTYETSPYCIALAWLLSKGENVLPIPGASKPSSIVDSAKAVSVKLAPADVAEIENLGAL